MLNKQGFDLWANDYDKTVQISEENNMYPFAGYKDILNLLDIGFGTGILATKLYENGHHLYGLDFSPEMMGIAVT